MQTLCPESGLRNAPNRSKIKKMTMTLQFCDMTSTLIFFWRFFVSLIRFSYWSKFHFNINTVSGIMTIFFYKGLTRNPEIGNTPVWDLPNIWRLGQVIDTKFGTNIFNKILLNAAKFRVTALTVFELLREKKFIRVKKFELDRSLSKKTKKKYKD